MYGNDNESESDGDDNYVGPDKESEDSEDDF